MPSPCSAADGPLDANAEQKVPWGSCGQCAGSAGRPQPPGPVSSRCWCPSPSSSLGPGSSQTLLSPRLCRHGDIFGQSEGWTRRCYCTLRQTVMWKQGVTWGLMLRPLTNVDNGTLHGPGSVKCISLYLSLDRFFFFQNITMLSWMTSDDSSSLDLSFFFFFPAKHCLRKCRLWDRFALVC